MRLLDIQCIHHLQYGAGQAVEGVIAQCFAGLAVAGQIQCIHRVFGRQLAKVEQPVVQITAKTMDQEHCLVTVTLTCVTQFLTVQLKPLIGRLGAVFVGFRRYEIGIELSDKSIDVRVRGVSLGQHPQQSAYRQHLIRFGYPPAQNTGVSGFDSTSDFIGLDVQELLARTDGLAFFGNPFADPAFAHRQAPFRHYNRANRSVSHWFSSTSFSNSFSRRRLK